MRISFDTQHFVVIFNKKRHSFCCIITLNADFLPAYLTKSAIYHIISWRTKGVTCPRHEFMFVHPTKQGKDYMIDINVKLNTMNDVKDFCNILSEYSFDALMKSGNDIVNAKSIIGIFSLDLQQETVLSVDTQTLLDLPERIYKYMA